MKINNRISTIVLTAVVVLSVLLFAFDRKPATQFRDYEIITATSAFFLQSQVSMKISSGYQCAGGLVVFQDEKGRQQFSQAVYR